MKTFHLWRKEDATGVSGTGRVAEGAVFSDGTAVVRWLTDKSSIGIYQSIEHVRAIHGHEGKTPIVFDDVDESVGEQIAAQVLQAINRSLEKGHFS